MTTLSVVMPVYNERTDELKASLAALEEALRDSGWSDPEVVLVDDGSTPPLDEPSVTGARVRVMRQTNQGRFAARQAGITAATGEHVLLLDSRVSLDPDGLTWVRERVDAGEPVWNGHCAMANPDSPYARFWEVITHAAWSDYLDDPRTMSFGLDEYDRFPKGTGHFLAPRIWLLEAIAEFDSRYRDSRFSSDDTHLLRALAARDRIGISPRFSSRYRNREALRPFLAHALHRGTTFFDGFGRRGTRFTGAIIALLPASLAAAVLAVRRPEIVGAGAVGAGASAALTLQRRGQSPGTAVQFGVLLCPFGIAFTIGVWRGLWLALRAEAHR